MTAHDLSMHLMRERDLLELMLFKLETQQTLLGTGRSRWVGHTAGVVERGAEAMTTAALERATFVTAVAAEWGAPEVETLSELVAVAPTDGWREVLQGHQAAMVALADEIGEMKTVNEMRLRSALRVTQETIAGLGEPTGEYDATGVVSGGGEARFLDTRA